MTNFEDEAKKIAEIVSTKQLAYGDSFKKTQQILLILYPEGIPVAAYNDALALIRVLDKIVRIATANGQKDMLEEKPWSDIMGYSLLSVCKE